MRNIPATVKLIQDNLQQGDLKPRYRGNSNPMAGHCFVATEVFIYLMGGKDAGWKSMNVRHENDSHWYAQHSDGTVVDITASQFSTPVPYDKGIGKGMMQRVAGIPSKRSKKVLERLGVTVK